MPRPRKSPRNDFQEKIHSLQSKEYKNIEEFCSAANITIGQYNNYQKTGANLPSIQIIKDMAKALHVDTAYLLGDTEYKNIEALQISELSGLKPESCDVLLGISKSESLKEIFEQMLLDENFKNLLIQTYRFCHSHNDQITIDDGTKIFDTEKITDPVRVSGYTKNGAISIFNRIIESIYDSNMQESADILCYSHIESLFKNLHDLKPYFTDKKDKQKLYKYIEDELSIIARIMPNSEFLKLSPETILDETEQFYKQIIGE